MDIQQIANDKFWLAYATNTINAAEANLKDAASTLAKLIATFWGIYTAAFSGGLVSGKVHIDNDLELVLLILPIPLLIAGYLVATWAQLPSLSTHKVDPRIPEDVMKFYNDSVKTRKYRLIITYVFICCTAIFLVVALFIANYNPPKSTATEKPAVAKPK
ncbi:MAG: hypothetical protein JST50_01490 [Bacteroidetes bacterium]|jgi:hypothetical protein|nr:hypothetical protein [Bacteroidota bacterium]